MNVAGPADNFKLYGVYITCKCDGEGLEIGDYFA